MENMSFTERVMKATNKTMELVVLLNTLKVGNDEDRERLITMINDIHSDEMELICELNEIKSETKSKELEIPNFMNVKG